MGVLQYITWVFFVLGLLTLFIELILKPIHKWYTSKPLSKENDPSTRPQQRKSLVESLQKNLDKNAANHVVVKKETYRSKRAKKLEKWKADMPYVKFDEGGERLGGTASQESATSIRRRKLVADQDKAYKQSLEVDKAKSLEEEQKRAKIASFKARCEEKRARLGPELSVEDESACPLILRYPSGERAMRTFNKDDTIQVVKDFVEATQGYDMEEKYELMMHYPKRVFNDPTKSLEDEELFTRTRHIVFVQEKM